MKYFFPIHLDGGNRGCEAIARSSAILLGEAPENIFGYCRDVDLDRRLGLAEFLTLVPCQRGSYLVDRFLAVVNRVCHTSWTRARRMLYPYRSFIRLISNDDIILFTGGDMFCYDDNELIYINDRMHSHGMKTVLWGCSMGPENQSPDKLRSLHRFTLIYARESLTYEYFLSLGLKNVCLLPDPAFILSAEECCLPEILSNSNVLGLNVSNYVMGGITLNSAFGREVLRLVDHILRHTNMQILLVPHVTWNFGGLSQDDRQIAHIITDYFGGSERIHILDIENMNYGQIRYAISKCRFFIGARTHAVISAYSMYVPTIALGYSIKSRGIAKDLGLDGNLVVNSKSFVEGELLSAFNYLQKKEDAIRQHLRSVMPEYCLLPYQIKSTLQSL